MPEGAHETETWVTIDRFRDLSTALVVRSVLEAGGIRCFLRDENMVRLDWQISNFIGGMRLQVLEDDRDAALELLNEMALSDALPGEDREAFAEDVCPHCGSTDVHREARNRGVALAVLYFLSLPVSRGTLEWHCDLCGAYWDDSVKD